MHVAILINGTDRWATARQLSGGVASDRGARAVRIAVATAARLCVDVLTLYAPMTEPGLWPSTAGNLATDVLLNYLSSEPWQDPCRAMRITVVDPRHRLGRALPACVVESRQPQSPLTRLHLRIVADSYCQEQLIQKAWRANSGASLSSAQFYRRLSALDPTALSAGAVDVLIRTGARDHLSTYVLWEAAYARVHRAPCMWPDFDDEEFERALDSRYRRPASKPTPISGVFDQGLGTSY